MATAMFTFFFPFFFFLSFVYWPAVYGRSRSRVYNIADTVEWQGCERGIGKEVITEKGRSPMSRQRHYWLYRDTSLPLAVTMYDVFIRNVHLHRGRNACIIKPRRPVVCVFLYTHGQAGERWPEEYASRWRVWRERTRVAARTTEREGKRERVICTYDVRGHPAIDSRE